MKTKTAWATPLIILATCLTACSRKAEQAGPPPPTVLVATVTPRDVPVAKEGVATLDGFINANINAQVQGYIISRDYKEGSVVKKGDLLFQIDPRPFEASLAQAKATLAKDKAMQLKASADQMRAMQLFMGKVISAQERDAAVAAAESNKANVDADEAAVKTAELNLGYTKITAPVDGIAGIASAQVGDLVSAPIKVTSEAAIATSVPVPMAIPRSAWASAGASLMPSPTMATTLPAACSDLILSAF